MFNAGNSMNLGLQSYDHGNGTVCYYADRAMYIHNTPVALFQVKVWRI